MNDHDRLRADPLIAACVGKQDLEGQERRREADRGMPLAGKSTLNRLELSKAGADPDSPYCKIVAELDGMARLLVGLFLDAHDQPPAEITLDIDPTDLGLFGTAADWLSEQARWEGKSNVRFVVLSRSAEELDGRTAYEAGYCPRGDAENRLKEQKYLFAGSLPCEAMRANQIRLYQGSFAYVLCMRLRRVGLAGTELSQAQCPTIRTRLFKIGSLDPPRLAVT